MRFHTAAKTVAFEKIKDFAKGFRTMASLGVGPKRRGNAMSEMQEITDNLHADAQVILFLRNRDYPGLLKFIDAQYGLKFIM